MVIIFIFFIICPNSQAQQSYVTFTPADKFSIPADNGTISFAVNGNYSTATFDNNAWTFTNLMLNGSTNPIDNISISTKNSNIIITSYIVSSTQFQSERLRYLVVGSGEQTLNFGFFSPGEPQWIAHSEWSIVINNVFTGEGDGWNLFDNGTVVVYSSTGNVSMSHYNFFAALSNGSSLSSMSFYQQHSVIIITATALAIVVIIGAFIKVKNRKVYE